MKIIGGRDYWDGATWMNDDYHVFKRSVDVYSLDDLQKRQDIPQHLATLEVAIALGVLFEKEKVWGYQRTFSRRKEICWNSHVENDKSLTVTFTSIFFCGKIYRNVRINGRFYWTRQTALQAAVKVNPKFTDLRSSWSWPKKNEFSIFDELGVYDATEEAIECAVNHGIVSLICGLAEIRSDLGWGQKTVFEVQDSVSMNSPFLGLNGLASMVDPVTANQEIEMWLGRFAIKDDAPQITDDIVKRDKHGFDEMSFRKGKSK